MKIKAITNAGKTLKQDVNIVRETEKAVGFKYWGQGGNELSWMPKSQMTEIEGTIETELSGVIPDGEKTIDCEIEIPSWLFGKLFLA